MRKINCMPSRSNFVTDTLFTNLAIVFDRASFYGLRSFLVVYLMSGDSHFTEEEALYFYAALTFAFSFARLIGGVISDFVLGTRWGAIAGAALHTVGFLLLNSTVKPLIFCGFALLVAGSGLTTSSLYARTGRLYLSKKEKMDGAFALNFTAVNVGSFAVALIFPFIVMDTKYQTVFYILAAFAFSGMLMSFFLSDDTRETSHVSIDQPTLEKPSLSYGHAKIVLLLFCLAALNWFFSGIGARFTNDHIGQIGKGMLTGITSASMAVIEILLVITWFFVRMNTFLKLALGAAMMGLTYLLLPSFLNAAGISITPVAVVLIISMTGEHILLTLTPSAIARYTNPRYMGTVLGGLSLLAGLVLTYLSDAIGVLTTIPMDLVLAGLGLTALSIVLYVYHKRPEKNMIEEQHPDSL